MKLSLAFFIILYIIFYTFTIFMPYVKYQENYSIINSSYSSVKIDIEWMDMKNKEVVLSPWEKITKSNISIQWDSPNSWEVRNFTISKDAIKLFDFNDFLTTKIVDAKIKISTQSKKEENTTYLPLYKKKIFIIFDYNIDVVN